MRKPTDDEEVELRIFMKVYRARLEQELRALRAIEQIDNEESWGNSDDDHEKQGN